MAAPPFTRRLQRKFPQPQEPDPAPAPKPESAGVKELMDDPKAPPATPVDEGWEEEEKETEEVEWIP